MIIGRKKKPLFSKTVNELRVKINCLPAYFVLFNSFDQSFINVHMLLQNSLQCSFTFNYFFKLLIISNFLYS